MPVYLPVLVWQELLSSPLGLMRMAASQILVLSAFCTQGYIILKLFDSFYETHLMHVWTRSK